MTNAFALIAILGSWGHELHFLAQSVKFQTCRFIMHMWIRTKSCYTYFGSIKGGADVQLHQFRLCVEVAPIDKKISGFWRLL